MSLVKVETEHVMVIPTDLFRRCGYFQGFDSATEKFLPVILDPGNTQYLPRDKMELDASFKQLIPYCIFRFQDDDGTYHVFQYTRGKKQGEKRLHSKRSIGIGGHICTLDQTDDSPYQVGLNRELEEEVDIQSKYQQSCVGLINDDENEVGQVHLGIVHLFDLDRPDVSAKEKEIVDSGFRPIEKLIDEQEHFETWSQICLKALF